MSLLIWLIFSINISYTWLAENIKEFGIPPTSKLIDVVDVSSFLAFINGREKASQRICRNPKNRGALLQWVQLNGGRYFVQIHGLHNQQAQRTSYDHWRCHSRAARTYKCLARLTLAQGIPFHCVISYVKKKKIPSVRFIKILVNGLDQKINK